MCVSQAAHNNQQTELQIQIYARSDMGNHNMWNIKTIDVQVEGKQFLKGLDSSSQQVIF
jgi:hypothetical protein